MLVRAPRSSDFTSRLRAPEVTARIGVWLGICFLTAFATGMVSHFAQDTPSWLTFPTRPVWLYRVTQGLHVVSGTAAVPLLLVKLWSVFPKLFERLHVRRLRELTVEVAERGSIAILVSAAIFELATGLANSSQWYPWSFSFRATHYAVAWIAIGSLLLHIGVKLPLIRAALAGDLDDDQAGTSSSGAMSRRGLLRATWLAAGVAALGTAGATVPVLRKVSVFGVRSGDGPQGIPINKSAKAARVIAAATSPSYALRLVHGDLTTSLTLADLESMPQNTAELPIACVEGWSASGRWTGVRVMDLLALMDAPAGAGLEIHSLQKAGAFRRTQLPPQFASDPSTLLALKLDGETLSIDHGYPCRLIAPDRPGVLQTKWVTTMRVLS